MQREGDFGGYVEAGKLAWNQVYIYSAHRNTWPPFMSIITIPLYWLDAVSFFGLRFIWLVGIVIAYCHIFKWTLFTFFQQKLVLKLKTTETNQIALTDAAFLAPFLLTFRIFIEEVSNLQVNVYLLWLCLLAFDLAQKNRTFLSGMVLASLMATKVYPIIILPFLVFKKKFRWLLFTLVGLAITHLAVLAFFGLDKTSLYVEWYVKQVALGFDCNHFNQSLWSWVCGLFSHTSRFNEFFFNLSSLDVSQTKLISLSIIGLATIYVAYHFIQNKKAEHQLAYQYIISISFIPVFSPLAWKCYFVFLVPVVIALFYQLRDSNKKFFLVIPLLLITFSSELFIGNTLSDYTESLGFITLSSFFISLFATTEIFRKHTP